MVVASEEAYPPLEKPLQICGDQQPISYGFERVRDALSECPDE
jgi:hypothetical protein